MKFIVDYVPKNKKDCPFYKDQGKDVGWKCDLDHKCCELKEHEWIAPLECRWLKANLKWC